MGRFLNKGNQKFARFVKGKYFVDKTEIIHRLLEKDEDEKFICNSRARRFGKSVTADMLVAYFSRGADSAELFAPLKCNKDALFRENLNRYDTIFVDIQGQFLEAWKAKADPNESIERNLVSELREAYPELVSDKMTLAAALSIIYDRTGGQFVIIFDEWDYPIRELEEGNRDREGYVEALRSLFKNSDAKDYIRLAYLTGIMPIVRTKGQSAVNNFTEYTMAEPRDLGGYIGFTEEEVESLCRKFGVDFGQMREWYNGYNLNGIPIYNAWSVTEALRTNYFKQYWTITGTYGDIEDLITRNFDGLREDILKMLSGNRILVDVDDGINDLQTFHNKEQVITALIHLGYCAYDGKSREAYIPNKEIQAVFYKSVRQSKNGQLVQFMKQSEKLLYAVLENEAGQVGDLVGSVHNDFISNIEYNDENSLSCTITIAMLSALTYYHRPIREFPGGKGFADIVYLPLPQYRGYPAIVVELKWNKSVKAAIYQIKDRQYPQALKGYAGDILLVGIAYDKKTKQHTCEIEHFG